MNYQKFEHLFYQEQLNDSNKYFYNYINLLSSYKNHRALIYLNSNNDLYLQISFTLLYLKIPQLLLSTKFHNINQVNSFKKEFKANLIIDQNFINDYLLFNQTNQPLKSIATCTEKSLVKKKNLNPIESREICFLTAGSSGRSKIVVHTFETLFYSALGTNSFYNLSKEESWAITLPVHHVGGYMISFRSLIAKFSYKFINWKDLTKNIYNFSYYSFVPTQIETLINNKNALANLKRAKVIIVSGAHLSHQLFIKLQSHNLNVSPSYGMTEMASQVSALKPADFLLAKSLYFKDALPYRTFTLKGSNICVKGQCLFKGYYCDDVTTGCLNNSFKTNDLATIKDNKFVLLGRDDQIIISGGENISLTKVEQLLFKIVHTWIKVISFEDKYLGEVPIAFIPSDSIFNEVDIKRLFVNIHKFNKIYLPKYIFKIEIKSFKYSYEQLTKIAELKLKNVYLLLHGFMGSPKEWDFFLKRYPDYHLLTPTLPYHDYNYAQMCEQNNVKDKLKEFFLDITIFTKQYSKISLYGYSLGGRLTLEWFLTTKPLNITRIILESTNPGIDDHGQRKTRLSDDLLLLKAIHSKKTLNEFLSRWYQAPIWGNYNYTLAINSKKNGPYKLWQKGILELSIGTRPSLWEKISQISIPVSYYCGEKDLKYIDIGKKLKSILNSTHLEIVKDCAHNLGDKRIL